ncbi:dedicator of cytokinesis protein 3 [Caerostris extrusa]|uniref:Dedicator of cytokinesis protein 3 n=1 Tax=Caerostris extrusa TaxID=172846 RepID=A0AAV4RHV7_CAEEX|nr:dedicator of cytokinesis protein 3 [Caerostris extrusa]
MYVLFGLRHFPILILQHPLPPLPCDLAKKNSLEPCGSNRSSSSGSSIYGHFFPEGSDEEEIYTHPQDRNLEVVGNIPLSPLSSVLQPPPLPNRPRSVALPTSEQKICNDKMRPQTSPMKDSVEDYSHPRGYPYNRLVSPNAPLKWLNTPDGIGDKIGFSPSNSPKGSARNSWSEQSLLQDEAPPLPPRGNEKRMVTSWTGMPQVEDTKPALPKRLSKRYSSPAAMINQSKELLHMSSLPDTHEFLTPHDAAPSPSSELSPPSPSAQSPPPLPNKRGSHNPSSLPTSPNQSPVRTPESMIRSHSIPAGVMPHIPQEYEEESPNGEEAPSST